MTDFIQRARDLRKNSTEAEKLLWSKLRNNQFQSIKFRRQHPCPPYTLDFYNEQHKVAIELDGGQHSNPEQQEFDTSRTEFLKKNGVRVIRFWNNDVLKNIDGVIEELKKYFPSDIVTASKDISPSPLPSPDGRGSKKRILIGEITTVHGIKGYVKVRSFVEDESLFEGNDVFTHETADNTIKLTIKNALKGDWAAQINGVNDRTTAESFRGTKLYIDRTSLPQTDEAEFYVEDLKGLRVVDSDSHEIGIVEDIVNFGAGDLLDIKPPKGQNFYLSFQDETILKIDIDTKTITAVMPEVV